MSHTHYMPDVVFGLPMSQAGTKLELLHWTIKNMSITSMLLMLRYSINKFGASGTAN